MKPSLTCLLTLSLSLSTFGCKKDFSCKNLQKGQWAVEFFDDVGQDGGCPYEGQAVLDGEAYELVCEVRDDECWCNAGDQFGTYEVTVLNTETGETDVSVVNVEAVPEPICIDRDRITSDEPRGLGGNGGAGGSDS